ncbi:DEAD/DEAH box helicase [Ruixingdingia sedimenti]|uniref:DEAD/DEAH box helicase family protein n=1 Tax=Ruixingdingia sedimenti TaxID=3073604 RepID=A0ABU1FC81_9RHOB|nr:DEAD/DEAH box helicase family protein [Xinfangfangia sp. LG-4]MDR5654475.1 DEAD/DEAH box helicase family protein [Xinfangfangia sp. LG-4]
MLRDYQAEDLAKVSDALKQGAQRVLFEASVGYGKSVLIETMAEAYSRTGRRVWVLSNRSSVINQLRKRAAHLPGVEVMTVQAADRRRAELAANPAALVLIDEVHMGGSAAQYGRVMACAPLARFIGFTGSPSPENFDTFRVHIQGRSSRWLTDQGFLSPLRYFAPNLVDLRGVSVKAGEFDESQVLTKLEEGKVFANSIDLFREHGVGVPTLGFCVNVKHAVDTAERFRKAGHKCEVLTGKDSDKAAAYKIDALSDAGLLFSVDKVSAGFDLPTLGVMLSMRPTASPRVWVQQLGRVARTAPGKTFGLVLDQVGNTLRHGTLTQERNWRGKGKRAWTGDDTHTEDGESLSVRQCPACVAVFEAGPSKCPQCGAELARDTRISRAESVRLKEMEAAEIERQQQEAAALRKRLGQTIPQMRAYLGHQTAVDNMRKRYDKAKRNGDADIAAFAHEQLRQARAL